MSDTSQGPGWWLASDGRWYPPQPTPTPAPTPAESSSPTPVAPTPVAPTPVEPTPAAAAAEPIPAQPTTAAPAPAGSPAADQPPAPGWWKASDGNWYPPAAAATSAAPPSPDSAAGAASAGAVAAGAGAAPAASVADGAAPAAAPSAGIPVTDGGPPPDAATPGKKSGKGLIVVGAIFVVLVLLAAGVFVATRSSSSGSGGNAGGPTDQVQVGAPRTDGQPAVPALGDDVLPDQGVTLTSQTVVVRGNGGRTIVSAAPDGHTMVLDPNVEGVNKLEAGKVLLLTGVTVVKVASVTTKDGKPEITTEPATLPDVIQDGDITWNDQQVDPAQARLVITGDTGWEAGPNGDGGAGSSGGSSGSDSSSGGSSDGSDSGGDSGGGSDSGGDTTDSSLVDPGDLELGAGRPQAARTAAVVDGESAAGATRAVLGKTVSGSAGDFGFEITYEGEGSGHHLDLKLLPKGDVTGTIEADIHLKSLANSGNIKMQGAKLQNFDFDVAELGGSAVITTDVKGLENVAKFQTPAFFKLPFSLDFPAFVGGIPFTLSLSGTIQVNLVFSMANSSLSGRAEITYDGGAGFHIKGTKLSLDGKRSQESPDLLETIKGVAPGPVGIVFTTELPKVGFGFKFLQTGAGIYISNGMVASQDILPPPVPCTAANVAYVLAGGVEASFVGKEFDIARKAFVDKRWEWAAPNDKRCKGSKPGG